MKKFIILILSLLFYKCTNKMLTLTLLLTPVCAQYMPDYDYYQLEIKKLESGYTLPSPKIIEASDSLIVYFIRGSDTTGGYISPYEGTIVALDTINNVPELWDDSTATHKIQYEFSYGAYELTLFEHSNYWGYSPRSEPLFFVILSNKPVKLIISW